MRKSKILLILLILFIPLFMFSQDLVLEYRCAESNTSTNQIKPHINIKNNGINPVDLSDLKVRYYYTLEDSASQMLEVDYAVIGASKVSGNFIQSGVDDYYLEVSFAADAGILQAGEQSGEIQLRFHKTNWTNYDQSNDYSFDPAVASFTEYDKIALYQNGVLVWGTGPEDVSLNITSANFYTTLTTVNDMELGHTMLDIAGSTDAESVTVKTWGDGVIDYYNLTLDANGNFSETVEICFTHAPDDTPFTVSTTVTATKGAITITQELQSGELQYLETVEEWVPYYDNNATISISKNAQDEYEAEVTLHFPTNGFRVTDWGTASDPDAMVETWTGSHLTVLTDISNTYNLGQLTPGDYTFTFKTWGTVCAAENFTVTEEGEVPIVIMTAPEDGVVYRTNDTVDITFAADVTDPDGNSISQVTFYAIPTNGYLIIETIGIDEEAPYEVTWTDLPECSYYVYATAVDSTGLSGTSTQIRFDVVQNQAPTASITNPANNAVIEDGNDVLIQADASDSDGTVESVEFLATIYDDSGAAAAIVLYEDTTAPYEYLWADPGVGNFDIAVNVIDNEGLSAKSSIVSFSIVSEIPDSDLKVQYKCNETNTLTNSIRANFNIINEGNDTVSLDELELRYYYTLEGSASHEFHCDYAVIGSSNVNGSFENIQDEYYYVSITFASGQISANGQTGDIQVRCNKVNWTQIDQSNDYSFDPAVTSYKDHDKITLYKNGVRVWGLAAGDNPDNIAPTVSITSPASGFACTVGETVTITADAEDSDGTVVLVEFYKGTEKIGEDISYPYECTWTPSTPGNVSITAIAIDDKGAETTSEIVAVTVNQVDTDPPIASITSPQDATEYSVGDYITITATASDPDGTVAKVEFYAGSSKIGEDLTSPYSYTWVNANPGAYSLKVIAYDNYGVTGESTSVGIVITGEIIENPYSEDIRLNQAGYATGDINKTAVVADMSGTFTINSLIDNSEVYSGTLTSLGSDNGESLYIADFSDLTTPGLYYIQAGTEKSPKFEIKDDLYSEVLYYTLRVYGANRCGPYDSWMHEDCHTLDGNIRGDGKEGTLAGGWHDCGDHVKFGTTIGYTTAMMLYSYMVWPESYGDAYSMNYDGTYNNPSPDGVPDVLNEVKVGTDYLLNLYKASVEDGLIEQNQMYYQVGDGDDDHSWWHLPQYQDAFPQSQGGSPREVWSDIASDLAGRFSASLTMMALVYAEYDAEYAAECLEAAKAIYTIAFNVYGTIGDSGQKGYYPQDTRCDDDLALAAVMLYKATNDDYYLNDTTGAQYWMALEQKWQFISYYVLSYPNVFSLVLHAYYPYASETDNDPSIIDTAIVTKDECIEWLKMEVLDSTVSDDLYGRRWDYSWGTCRYIMGVASTASLAYDLDPAADDMLQIVKDQMNWVFGRNQFGLSFVVGNTDDNWLTKYPEHPHHRAANPEGENVPELDTYEATELTGGTIGGPESHTEFVDEWDRYTSTETGIDYWAGTFFTAAFLVNLYK